MWQIGRSGPSARGPHPFRFSVALVHGVPSVSPNSVELQETMANPIDLVERMALGQEWPCERRGDDELTIELAGQWCHYKLCFAWHGELGVMQVSAALDLSVPARRLSAVNGLLALANEKLWLGHFELWSAERLPVFRHSMIFRDGNAAGPELIEDLVDVAMNECERFYPAFQFVIQGGKRAEEAMQLSLLETEGEA